MCGRSFTCWKVRARPSRATSRCGMPAMSRSEEAHLAGRHRQRAGQQVEHGRLAGAVGPDQADDLAGVHVEAHVVDRHQAAEALDRAVDRQDAACRAPAACDAAAARPARAARLARRRRARSARASSARTKPIRPPRAKCSSRMKSVAKATASSWPARCVSSGSTSCSAVLQHQHQRRADQRARQLARGRRPPPSAGTRCWRARRRATGSRSGSCAHRASRRARRAAPPSRTARAARGTHRRPRWPAGSRRRAGCGSRGPAAMRSRL